VKSPPAVREWDLRAVTSANSVGVGTQNAAGVLTPGPFHGLHRARTALENAAVRVQPFFATDRPQRVGELLALAGMTYVLAGEHFCSGAPFSERTPQLEYGSPATTAQMFNLALTRLTAASAASASDATVNNLIAVLRGRALLDLGQFAQAAAAVAAVPTSFNYQFFHSATTLRQNNQLFLQNDNDIYSIPSGEGTNGLNFSTANDPRLPARLTNRTPNGTSRNDTVTQMYYFIKYTGVGDPVSVATGVEARLIEAEAALQAGDVNGWLGFLNAARTHFNSTYVQAPGGPPPLAALADPGTQTARVDLMFRERAFSMFLTSHRLGDLRRMVRQYGRAIESVYPTAAYHKQALIRGTQANLIVPQSEENNPNYKPGDCKVKEA
jgi:starch-binding outer membrane protein, SusD/RagB family